MGNHDYKYVKYTQSYLFYGLPFNLPWIKIDLSFV
jgi:hypothetical protein